MLEEWNKRSRRRNELSRRNINKINLFLWHHRICAFMAYPDLFRNNLTCFRVNRCICRCNLVATLLIRGKFHDFIREFSVFYSYERGLDKSHLVDLRICRKRCDKSNVLTFRCLNGTESPVVRWVNVTNLKSRRFSGQTTFTKR